MSRLANWVLYLMYICSCLHLTNYLSKWIYNINLIVYFTEKFRLSWFKYLMYSTNHVYLHRPNAFGFWQTRLHLCYETLKRVSNFSELA